MPETKDSEIKLYQDSKKYAERKYKELRRLPFPVRKNLQMLIDDVPLTKELEGKYVSDDGSY